MRNLRQSETWRKLEVVSAMFPHNAQREDVSREIASTVWLLWPVSLFRFVRDGGAAFVVLLALAYAALFVTLLVPADGALLWQADVLPYSPVWYLLNPFVGTRVPYRVFLACFEAVALGCLLYAVRRWRLPVIVALVQLAVLFSFSWLHWHQNLTVVAWAWTAYYVPALSLLALQKFPVGWSLDLSDPHWACLSSCFTYGDGSSPDAGFNLLQRSLTHDFVYLLLAVAVAFPLVMRQVVKYRSRTLT